MKNPLVTLTRGFLFGADSATIRTMPMQWTTQNVAKTLGLSDTGPDQPISFITTDSRAVKSGALFVAIKGDHHDGHDFIEQAIQQGAVAILSEKPPIKPAEVCQLQVQSTLKAIRSLAHTYRRSFKIPVIGVVGAVGKTTTKELLASVFKGKFEHVSKTEGSQNGYLGIPLTLLQMKTDTEIAIIEIGIDEIGAMEQHLALVEPTHVILTKTGPEHLHQLKTVEIAAEEELKAFDYALKHGIPMAINLSDEFVSAWYQRHPEAAKSGKCLTYSLEKSTSPAFLGNYHASEETIQISGTGFNSTFSCPLPGEHHAHNLLAAITLSRLFSLNPDEVKKGLGTFKTAYGRTELYKTANGTLVIGDYYNSNPTSLEAALKLLTSTKGAPEYHAALGDMLELGDEEEQFHRAVASQLRSTGVTHVWLYGSRMNWLLDQLKKEAFTRVQHFESQEALAETLVQSCQSGARILIKGSRGMRMEKVLRVLVPEAAKA
jgi:UDP-N-acetylmuramoyl-tripeptide--D-alanyl-D-alanine ligase